MIEPGVVGAEFIKAKARPPGAEFSRIYGMSRLI